MKHASFHIIAVYLYGTTVVKKQQQLIGMMRNIVWVVVLWLFYFAITVNPLMAFPGELFSYYK